MAAAKRGKHYSPVAYTKIECFIIINKPLVISLGFCPFQAFRPAPGAPVPGIRPGNG